METIKTKVALLKKEGLTSKQIFNILKEKNIKTTINSVRHYYSKCKLN